MLSRVPDEWLANPPESLVIGDGPYARALAAVLGQTPLSLGQLRAGPGVNDFCRYPRIFENLRRGFLVVSEGMTPAEVVECHNALWKWIGKIASAGEQHDVAFVLILPEFASSAFEETIAVGLGLPALDPDITGHAAWRRSNSLIQLVETVLRTQPMDLLVLRARQAADIKRHALFKMQQAVGQGDAAFAAECARRVLKVFGRTEYSLDVFCRAPSHRHGNLLRAWLTAAVTEPVTQEWWATGKKHLINWLAEPDENK